MPTDTSIADSVIRAFIAGKQLRNQRQAQEAIEQHRQAQLEQDQAQFEDRIKATQEANQAVAKYRDAMTALQVPRVQQILLEQGRQEGTGRPVPFDVTDELVQGLGGISGQDFSQVPREQIEVDVPQILQSLMGQTVTGASQREIERQTARQARLAGDISAETKGKEAGAVAEAQLPSRRALEVLQGINRIGLEEAKQEFTAEQKQLDRESREKIATDRLAAMNARVAAKEQLSGSEIDDYADFLAKGHIKVTNIPSSIRGKVVTKLKSTNQVPFTEREYYAEAVPAIQDFIRQVKLFRNKHQSEFATQGKLSRAASGAQAGIESIVPLTDFAVDFSELKAQIGNLVKAYGGESASRLSNQDIQRMEAFLPERPIPLNKVDERIKDMELTFRNIMQGKLKIMGVKGQQQRDIMEELGFDAQRQGSFLTIRNKRTGETKQVPDTPSSRKRYGL